MLLCSRPYIPPMIFVTSRAKKSVPPNRGHALHSVSPICCHANFQRRFLLHEERKIARNKRIRNAYFAPYYFSLFSLRDKSSIAQIGIICKGLPEKNFFAPPRGHLPAPRAFFSPLRTILTKNTYSGNAIFHFFGYNQRRKQADGRSGKKRQEPRPARRRK